MDYDATNIPSAYDRGRDHGPEVLRLWMDAVSSHVDKNRIQTVLDLGCGTGRFSEALAITLCAEVVGVDPSAKMLEQARQKQEDVRVRYESGCGEAIPLPDQLVDLIFISMSFHHFNDAVGAVRECRRVLRKSGIVFLRAGSSERISEYPYVDFFPKSRPLLEECLSSTRSMRDVFESAGFEMIASYVITQEIARNYSAYADKLSTGSDSVLARLTPNDFAAGIEALRSYAASTDEAVFEPIDVLVFR